MELLLGSGNSWTKKIARDGDSDWRGLVTLDINPDCKPDIIWDLNDLPLPLEDNTCDEIHAYDVLEHCGTVGDWRFFLNQWSDFWRILKPGGHFFCIAPHYTSPWAFGDPGHTRVITLESLVFLSQPEYSKQVGITPMTDYRHWYKADFELVHQAVTPEKQIHFVLEAKKPARK
jgi:SAM-dependent methyltransferase